MAREKCDHCETIHRVKTWWYGQVYQVSICNECARRMLRLQEELIQWVG